jgi:hypothetical protein
VVKSKTSPLWNQSPSQPRFQPSTSTPRKPCFAAKSMWRLALAVVAPCLLPLAQVERSRCISHHTPTNLAGWNQLTSPSRLGSLRLSSRLDSYSAPAVVATRKVRHGVVNAPRRSTAAPVALGASCARSFWPCTRRSHIDA